MDPVVEINRTDLISLLSFVELQARTECFGLKVASERAATEDDKKQIDARHEEKTELATAAQELRNRIKYGTIADVSIAGAVSKIVPQIESH